MRRQDRMVTNIDEMCIRDRGCIVIAKSGLAQSLYQQQMDDNTFEKWYMATAVSYTHLDVYKRQDYGSPHSERAGLISW